MTRKKNNKKQKQRFSKRKMRGPVIQVGWAGKRQKEQPGGPH